MSMKLLNVLRKVKKSFSAYSPTVEVFIYKENLLHNLNEYKQKYPQLTLAPVLKSNAYGHGLIQVAQILDKEKPAFFVVDSLFEAKALRNEDIKSKILVIGFTSPENIKYDRTKDISFAITSLDQLKIIDSFLKKKKNYHLKIDTGMHRQGILMEEIKEAVQIIKNNKFINLEGVCSHLADADNPEKNFTEEQIKKWQQVVEIFKQEFKEIKFFHLAATAGASYAGQINGNVLRLGLGLYGINLSSFEKLNLKPVLEMQSVISSIKKIREGECVGYNAAFKTDKEISVATVPVGYFEGIDRRLFNCGFFKIKDNFCPIIGKVSMNITSISVDLIKSIKIGDKVIAISHNPQDKNSVENIAKLTDTIPYEVLVHIPQHLRRIII